MLASQHPRQKRCLRKKQSGSQKDDIPLSRLGAKPLVLQGQVDNVPESRQQRTYWPLMLCYFLHAFLVVLHLILLGIAVPWHHAERRAVIQDHIELFTTGLSGGLQAFYTFYTALLVFVTQKLMLSSIFSRPKKLTQIHDICGAWAGLGASLNALWQQTKVASSVLSIALVAMYFVCVSVLHVTSTAIIQLQLFNDTVTHMGPVLATWPNASTNLMSFDWMTVTVLVPFLQNFYGNTTNGLADNTLYDVPQSDFINATIKATTVNANCGLLTNLSIESSQSNSIGWNVTASMPALGPITFAVLITPFFNEIWFSPYIECYQPICSTLLLYLVSAEMKVDDSLGGVNYVYINSSGSSENDLPRVYFVACSLDATSHTVVLDSSGIQIDSGVQPADAAWPAFSPGGDLNLTSGISNAMGSANQAFASPECLLILGGSNSTSLSAFNAYMDLILGMTTFPCTEKTPGPYPNTPLLLARDQFESAISQFAAEFLWLAGELGSVGGGFDRQTEEASIMSSMPQWKLNINTLPIIIALCASIILFVLVVSSLQRHHLGVVSSAGVLEMMWFGSRSQVLRSHLSDLQTPSLDGLRTSNMFDTIFWAQSTNKYEENSDSCAPVPPCNLDNSTSSSRHERLSGSEATPTLCLSDSVSIVHPSNAFRTRRLCHALHIIFVALHVILLTLLVHHPEQSVVIPSEAGTLTIGLSAFLQGFYTLYSAALILLVQRLGLFKIVSERQKLTTVHDVSGAWTGIGAAINILWRQRKVSSSTWDVIGVGAYLTLMLVLHTASSSIMQWQAFYDPLTGVAQMYLALPNSSVGIDQIMWPDIPSFWGWIGVNSLSTPGLSNTTLYDIPQNPIDLSFTSATVNATTLTAQCDLVPNLTLSTHSGQYYHLNFLNGTHNSSFFGISPIGTDTLYQIFPSSECSGCPQTLFFMITTGMNVDQSVQDPVFVELNLTITLSSGESTSAIIPTYIAACSVNAQTSSAQLNLSTGVLETIPNTTTIPTRSSWSLWSPGNAVNDTNLADKIVNSLNSEGGIPSNSYITSLLGLNSSIQSIAAPSVTLTPWQMENAIAQALANLLWFAGQIGEDGGGFQRSVGESKVEGSTMRFRLHLETVPVFVASVAALLSLVLATLIIGKPSGERHTPISGTSVLECLWLEAHSKYIHAHMETIEKPHPDRLRAAGMFDICLGDVGQSSYPEREQPTLALADERFSSQPRKPLK